MAGMEYFRVFQCGAARLARDLLVVIAIGKQALEHFAPGGDVLLRDFRHGDHLFIEARFVLFDGMHGQEIRDAHHGLWDAADIGRHDRYTAQQRFENDARTRLGPQGRHQQYARALEQKIDIVNRGEYVYVRPRL